MWQLFMQHTTLSSSNKHPPKMQIFRTKLTSELFGSRTHLCLHKIDGSLYEWTYYFYVLCFNSRYIESCTFIHKVDKLLKHNIKEVVRPFIKLTSDSIQTHMCACAI